MAACIAEGSDRAVWVGTGDGCVWKLGEAAPVVRREGHVVTALHVDADGTLCVGWEDGITRRTADDPPKETQWEKVVLKFGFVSGPAYIVDQDAPIGEVECIGRTAKGLVASSVTQGPMNSTPWYNLWDVSWAHFWGPNTQWLSLRDLFPSKRVEAQEKARR